MNVLITSVGRQVFLVNAFKKAIGKKGKVFASDVDKNAPGLEASDIGFISPAFTDENYITWLTEICRRNGINLLITLNVDDLLVLENNRDKLNKESVFLVGGNIQNIKNTYDKYKLFQFCLNAGIHVPKTYLVEDCINQSFNTPIIAKPRFGKGSRGHRILSSKSEINEFIETVTKCSSSCNYVFQEYLPGQEFGMDLVNNFKSDYAGVLVRKKFAMKNGETDEAISVSPIEWVQLAKKLSIALDHQGTIDIDIILFKDKKFVIDINHRFGGGYIFNHASGAHLPKAYVHWLLDKDSPDEASKYLSYSVGVQCRREALGYKVVS